MNLEPRHSLVPWLQTGMDLEEGRRFMWEVEYHRDEEKAICLEIDAPFREVTQAYLVIHAIRGNGNDGGTITLALSPVPRYDVYAQETFALNLISNPRRDHSDDGA